MYSKFVFSVIILLTATTMGCTYESAEETFIVESGYYQYYEFDLLEYDILEMAIDTGNTPINIYVLDHINFNKYESSEIFESIFVREDTIKTQLYFEAANEGKYYVVFESLSSDARIDVSYEIY